MQASGMKLQGVMWPRNNSHGIRLDGATMIDGSIGHMAGYEIMQGGNIGYSYVSVQECVVSGSYGRSKFMRGRSFLPKS